MNQVATDLWPILLPTILAGVGIYIGFINKMRSQIAVLEAKVKPWKKNATRLPPR